MPYRWDDDYGARLGVLRRDDPFGEIRWFEIDPCYVFHVANAHDAPTAIRLCCRRFGIRSCGVTTAASTPRRCCGAGQSTCRRARVSRTSARRPRAWSSRASTTGWPACPPDTAVSVGDAQPGALRPDAPGRPSSMASARLAAPARRYSCLAVGAADESNGWYLGYVYDPARDGSDLVILDASDFGGEPVATDPAAATGSVRLPRQLDSASGTPVPTGGIAALPDCGSTSRQGSDRIRGHGGMDSVVSILAARGSRVGFTYFGNATKAAELVPTTSGMSSWTSPMPRRCGGYRLFAQRGGVHTVVHAAGAHVSMRHLSGSRSHASSCELGTMPAASSTASRGSPLYDSRGSLVAVTTVAT